MRKALRWIGIVLAAVVGLLVLIVGGLFASASARIGRAYEVEPEVVAIPSDPESIHLGEQWVSILCTECHGENLQGTVMFDDPTIGRIVADNLTAGVGGAGATYTDADWVGAIRHGIGPEGKALFVMPSESYYYFSDQDLGAIIAYLKSVAPMDHEPGEISITPMARLLVAAGILKNPFPAESIDHAAPRPVSPEPGVNAEYGEYVALVFGCWTCHGADLGGGQHPDPNGPPVPNVTTGGSLAGWSEEDFLVAARTRTSKWMPWAGMSKMTDDQLQALWLYLQAVPAAE